MRDDKVRPFRYTKGRLSIEITMAVIVATVLWRAGTWGFRRLKPAFYHPVALGGTSTYLLAYLASPWAACALLWGVVGWALIKPDSYRRHALWRTQSFLAGFQYRYRPRRRLKACGIINDDDPTPTISAIHKQGCTTKIRIKMSYGDDVDYWRERSSWLAQTYNALDCKVNPYRREVLNPFRHTMVTKPRWLQLEFLTKDPFASKLGIEYINYHQQRDTYQPVDATYRNGQPHTDNLASHKLLVAMTRRGKSNAIRALTYAQQHNIKAGLLEQWMIDGKGGVEGAFMQHQVARHAYGDTDLNPNAYNPAEFDRLLKDAVIVLKRRQKKMRGNTTTHEPTPTQPWLRIIIDELLVLTSRNVTPELRNSIAANIMLIQQQGIACGVSIVACTQLAQKDLIMFRDGFTEFHVGKVEKGAIDMIFGTGWWERGARADEIPDDLPGVFYVKTDATMTPTEIRYPEVTDADLRTLPHARDSVLWKPQRHLKPVPATPASVQSPPQPQPEPESEDALVDEFDGVGGFA